MSREPVIYQVRPEQVGGADIMDFLRQQLARNFGTNFEIVSEQTLNKNTTYSKTPRRIVAFLVEVSGEKHSVFFDTTECSAASNINWLGH